MTMIGQEPALASKPLSYACDGLTKNTLIDLAIDLARGELGEDASDEAVIDWLQSRLGPVYCVRGQKPVNIAARYEKFCRASREYQQSHT